ncbi:(2Fe-2S)-binding protein [Carboxylicivirga sp. RSCT41]|uniref:(2Fe-2S)-binding protein n=1 Tax=Carboxylicivirga agarovorans TaxID=3417570 RepID=UPI003D35836D
MDRLICLCKGVRENTIKDLINKIDFPSLEIIQENTNAATNCGRCINAIETLIKQKA